MSSFRGMTSWTVCCLALALLVLIPSTASARRRARFSAGAEDPLCQSFQGPTCEKFRIGALGGGILSSEGSSPGAGIKGSVFWVLGRRMEVGLNLMVMTDPRFEDGPYFGSAEGILRVATVAGPSQRVFMEFSIGGSRYDSPEIAYWAFPSGSVAATLELSGPGMGVFFTGGLSLLWAEGLAALPHAGIGLVF